MARTKQKNVHIDLSLSAGKAIAKEKCEIGKFALLLSLAALVHFDTEEPSPEEVAEKLIEALSAEMPCFRSVMAAMLKRSQNVRTK